MPSAGFRLMRAVIAVFEKIKNKPALNPQPRAEYNVKKNKILSMITNYLLLILKIATK